MFSGAIALFLLVEGRDSILDLSWRSVENAC